MHSGMQYICYSGQASPLSGKNRRITPISKDAWILLIYFNISINIYKVLLLYELYVLTTCLIICWREDLLKDWVTAFILYWFILITCDAILNSPEAFRKCTHNWVHKIVYMCLWVWLHLCHRYKYKCIMTTEVWNLWTLKAFLLKCRFS